MFAAHEGNLVKVNLLTNSNAAVAMKNKKGQTAQDLATLRNAVDVAAFLAQKRA
jgi:ankyrin repeat protein